MMLLALSLHRNVMLIRLDVKFYRMLSHSYYYWDEQSLQERQATTEELSKTWYKLFLCPSCPQSVEVLET